jgi:hypothetical protein
MHHRRRKIKVRPKEKRPTDFEMLEEILQKIHKLLKNGELEPKVADFLKVLEMKHKLRLTREGKEETLDVIEKARKMVLGSE